MRMAPLVNNKESINMHANGIGRRHWLQRLLPLALGAAGMAAGLAGCASSPGRVPAAPAAAAAPVELYVMNSGGFAAAYKALQPAYERASGHRLISIWGPSMGESPQSIPSRLARGEPADVVIMVGYALDKLMAEGKVLPGSKVDLADSRIGAVVKAGSPRFDVSSIDGLRAALLQAPSVAYSDSASGVYVERELFRKLGVQAQVQPKAHKVERIPVAERVAAGEYALGFQQVSEILPVPGVTYLGKIPESVQSTTTFSAGVAANSRHPAEAQALIRFLASPQAQQAITASGMDVRTR